MKLKNIVAILGIAGSCMAALPAIAQVNAQRSCQPEDIYIHKGSSAQQTLCTWYVTANDNSMQVTLHPDKDASPINANCAFIPASGSTDQIDTVVGRKNAEIVGGDKSINGNFFAFQVNYLGDTNGENANLLFYLNKEDGKFTDGDKLVCSFTASK